jgi:hypothetical protein
MLVLTAINGRAGEFRAPAEASVTDLRRRTDGATASDQW